MIDWTDFLRGAAAPEEPREPRDVLRKRIRSMLHRMAPLGDGASREAVLQDARARCPKLATGLAEIDRRAAVCAHLLTARASGPGSDGEIRQHVADAMRGAQAIVRELRVHVDELGDRLVRLGSSERARGEGGDGAPE